MNDLADAELIRRSLQGEQTAFATLVRRYQNRVAVTIRGIIQNATPEELQDYAQDVFLLAWRSLSSFRGESQFGTYLTRIAIHFAWRESKRRAKRMKRETATDFTSSESQQSFAQREDESRTDSALLSRERGEQLRRALEQLPDEFRLVLILRVVEELPVEQVAEILGVSTGTVKSRLSRAREKMKGLLGNDPK